MKVTRSGMTRRAMLATSVAAGVSAGLSGFARAADRIVFATWGGSWEEAMRKTWADPFTKQTGIEVVSAPGNTFGRLQAMVESGNTEWDVVEGLPELARLGAERGLLEPIDFSIVDRSLIMDVPGFVTDYSVPEQQFGRIMVYSDRFSDSPPETWSDFWDLERFPGRRTFYNRVESGLIEMTLAADGVAPEHLYPLDIDRALAKLDEIREEILWHETPAQGEQYLSDGQAPLGLLADGRARNIVRHGAPVKLQPKATVMTWSVLVVPKGAPNKEAAMRFLAFTLTPQAQADVAMEYFYGPVTAEAWKLIPEETVSELSGSPAMTEHAIYLNADYWAENLESASEKFHTWLLG